MLTSLSPSLINPGEKEPNGLHNPGQMFSVIVRSTNVPRRTTMIRGAAWCQCPSASFSDQRTTSEPTLAKHQSKRRHRVKGPRVARSKVLSRSRPSDRRIPGRPVRICPGNLPSTTPRSPGSSRWTNSIRIRPVKPRKIKRSFGKFHPSVDVCAHFPVTSEVCVARL